MKEQVRKPFECRTNIKLSKLTLGNEFLFEDEVYIVGGFFNNDIIECLLVNNVATSLCSIKIVEFDCFKLISKF